MKIKRAKNQKSPSNRRNARDALTESKASAFPLRLVGSPHFYENPSPVNAWRVRRAHVKVIDDEVVGTGDRPIRTASVSNRLDPVRQISTPSVSDGPISPPSVSDRPIRFGFLARHSHRMAILRLRVNAPKR